MIDDEGLPITYSTFLKSHSDLPSFITFDKTSQMYTISPVSSDKAEKYTIQIDLTDSMGASKSYTFDVNVIDSEEIRIRKGNSNSKNKGANVKIKDIKAKIFIQSVSR